MTQPNVLPLVLYQDVRLEQSNGAKLLRQCSLIQTNGGYPRQARDFAKATGKLTNTDKVDAGVLAHFGEAVKPKVRLPDEQTQALAALLTRRGQ